MEAPNDLDPRELRGIAVVLASIVRFGQTELARQIADTLELDYLHFVAVADEADLKELREALAV